MLWLVVGIFVLFVLLFFQFLLPAGMNVWVRWDEKHRFREYRKYLEKLRDIGTTRPRWICGCGSDVSIPTCVAASDGKMLIRVGPYSIVGASSDIVLRREGSLVDHWTINAHSVVTVTHIPSSVTTKQRVDVLLRWKCFISQEKEKWKWGEISGHVCVSGDVVKVKARGPLLMEQNIEWASVVDGRGVYVSPSSKSWLVLSRYFKQLKGGSDILQDISIVDGPLFVCKFEGKDAIGMSTEELDEVMMNANEQNVKEETTNSDIDNLVIVPIGECSEERVVGGKGMQLSVLRKANFEVPSGFVLTTKAHSSHVEDCNDVTEACSVLSSCSLHDSVTIKKQCDILQEFYMTTPLKDSLKHSVRTALSLLSGSRFSVRSSAVGEDGMGASSAGQFETVLGVKRSGINEAVQKCWASQYSIRAVNYRLHQGQPIYSNMAVVVQEMIDADAAGVLFTMNPTSGKWNEMVLTASIGVGESVVAGLVDPDTFILERDDEDNIKITEEVAGRKEKRVDVCGNLLEVEEDTTLCIPDSIVLELGRIGILVEKVFPESVVPRDIEWCVHNDKVYLLQARPVTTLVPQSVLEWDVMHEFDTPLDHPDMWLSKSNIGEMCPASLSPLGHSIFADSIDYGMQALIVRSGALPEYSPYYHFMASQYGHLFLNLYGFSSLYTFVGLNDKRMSDMSISGHTLDGLTLEEMYEYQGHCSKWARFKNSLGFMWMLYSSRVKMERIREHIENGFEIHRGMNALQTFWLIDLALPMVIEGWAGGVQFSSRSGVWGAVIMSMVGGNKKEWGTKDYAEMAQLLAHCSNVESADVPTALEKIVDAIVSSDSPVNLNEISAEDALKYLQNPKNAEVNALWKKFLKRHGHRCIREADPIEHSWAQNPMKLIPLLQGVYSARRCVGLVQDNNKDEKSLAEMEMRVDQLLSKYPFGVRKAMKWMLPKARAAVGQRELSKSISVHVADCFKQGYWRLANQMEKESIIPNAEIMFFLTHREIGQLLSTAYRVEEPSVYFMSDYSSADLLHRASQRRRVHFLRMNYVFPEICVGEAKPIESDENEGEEGGTMVSGMPVGLGKAIATCRVVTELDDAPSIQPGEILLCPFTDIGWTPYFPRIVALVTELGGLLSHGAVVAREYGIPCVVNARGVTSVFHTGDKVCVDGESGTVTRVLDI